MECRTSSWRRQRHRRVRLIPWWQIWILTWCVKPLTWWRIWILTRWLRWHRWPRIWCVVARCQACLVGCPTCVLQQIPLRLRANPSQRFQILLLTRKATLLKPNNSKAKQTSLPAPRSSRRPVSFTSVQLTRLERTQPSVKRSRLKNARWPAGVISLSASSIWNNTTRCSTNVTKFLRMTLKT